MSSTPTCPVADVQLEPLIHWYQFTIDQSPHSTLRVIASFCHCRWSLLLSASGLSVSYAAEPICRVAALLCRAHGDGAHALMTSACLVSSFSADSTWHCITASLQTSRSHDSPSEEEMLALSGSAIVCVCWGRVGGVVMETSCKSTRVPSNFVFLVLLWPGSSGAPRWLGHLSFSRAFIVPELWSLPNNLIMAKLSWTTSTKLPHSVCFS